MVSLTAAFGVMVSRLSVVSFGVMVSRLNRGVMVSFLNNVFEPALFTVVAFGVTVLLFLVQASKEMATIKANNATLDKFFIGSFLND